MADITVTHTRNPLIGWDICASAKGDKDETISRARIIVNSFPEYDQSFDTPLNQWQHQLTQQGNFPGDNKVLVEITNNNGDIFRRQDSWT